MRMNGVALVRSPMVSAFGLSLLVTAGLFWLMHAFMGAKGHGADAIEALPAIDFVRLRRDSQVETLERRKPPPPPPEQPPPPARMKVATESVQQQSAPTPFAMPNLGLSANVGGGPFLGEMGGVSGASTSMFDGDIIPLQRIAPQYPREAARARITGWVQLEVTVNADGSVRSAKVTDAKPKGLFDAAAVTAVLRWKFKPKIVNGTPVEQRGLQRIEFDLTSSG
jgi:protein TonB